ncbi:hypothetical protein V6U77_10855 [Micromonospora sp. CPCC 205546]|uniref:hypothetical protein n=1 Tax=Micromonospora sp. CPCC 205546 TaxID=3122397 RepID=UPI002FF0CC25
MAGRVEDAMPAALDVPFDQATPAARIRAHARLAYGGEASRAEYAEAAYRPALGPWLPYATCRPSSRTRSRRSALG